MNLLHYLPAANPLLDDNGDLDRVSNTNNIPSKTCYLSRLSSLNFFFIIYPSLMCFFYSPKKSGWIDLEQHIFFIF